MKKFLFGFILLSLLFSSCGHTDNEIIYLNSEKHLLEFSFSTSKQYSFDFHSKIQKEYLDSERFTTVPTFAQGSREIGKPVELDIDLKHCFDSTSSIDHLLIETSLNEDFSNSVIYQTNEETFTLTNFYSDQTYYLKVKAIGEKITESATSILKTTPGLRNLDIDGVTNVRDVGGYTLIDGRKVKQGLLFRGSRLSDNYTDSLKLLITQKGIEQYKALGIKSELDLRRVDNNERGYVNECGAIDGDFNYFSVPMDYDKDLLRDDFNIEGLRKAFNILSEPTNYPIYFHCSAGADRTGVISFLVNGLLGASNMDLFKDYLFTNYGNIGGARSSSTISNYIRRLEIYHQGELSLNIEKYLLDTVKISQAQIDTIKELLTY